MPDYDIDIDIEIAPSPEIDMEIAIDTKSHEGLYDRDLPDQHPISAITNLREELNELKKIGQTYVFEQDIPIYTWEIEHNLQKFPSVVVVDSAGSVVIGDIVYIDENNLQVLFSSKFAGKAYLN